jgi:hypothetical protein
MATKFKCGSIIPSSCVPFTGKDLSFLTEEEQVACDANINDVIEKISDAIKDIEESIDLSEHTSSCMEFDEPILVKDVLQEHDSKICELDAAIATLQGQLDGLNIANELVTIDLGCLASAASPCQVSTNTYTLIAILNLFRTEICAIKAELGI